MPIHFKDGAWSQYTDWQDLDRKTLRRINRLLKSINRDGSISIGKVEKLKGDLSGLCSARIDEKNRLIFYVEGDIVVVVSCSGHYE